MPLSATEYQELRQLQARVAKLERTVEFLLHHFELDYVDDPSSSIPGVDAEIMALVQAGKTIDAIRLYRERTGADLLTAKTVIEGLTR
ncbi:MAG TPA: hypothetical protein VHD90_13285 [Phototrophicaceae bacterium]|nr:hypothetical protein [Phototrophicaceae bacterium]